MTATPTAATSTVEALAGATPAAATPTAAAGAAPAGVPLMTVSPDAIPAHVSPDAALAAPAGVFVHPHGLCESADVGAGTRVWAFAHVLPGARVGRDCNICDCAFVEDGAALGDRVTVKNGTLVFRGVTCEDEVFLGPNVLFTNDLRPRAAIKRDGDALLTTTVRRGASLGAGVVVVCGHEIGAYAFAAAGAVITRDVPAHAFVAGNPAVRKGWVCACGDRLDEQLACLSCGSMYEAAPGGGLRASGDPRGEQYERIDQPRPRGRR